MVDIHIGAIPPVQNNQGKRQNPRRDAQTPKKALERRKRKTDRRSSARSGVTVSLSTYPERRKRRDRRKTVYSSHGS